jgi:hypothetical protein
MGFRRRSYQLDELLSVITLRRDGYKAPLVATILRRSASSIREKFKSLPTSEFEGELTLPAMGRFTSIQSIYEAFGVPCPETVEQLEADMFRRFKKWEAKIAREFR